MNSIRQDVAYGLRMLLRNKAFSIPALLTLSLGIGVNTAIFSLVYGVLLRPLPFADAGRIVRLSESHVGATAATRDAVLSNLTFDAWRHATRAIDGLAAYSERAYTVTGIGDAERVIGSSVSPALFPILNVAPAAGRFFTDEDAVQGADDVVVLAYGYWQQRFGGRPDIVGQTIALDARARIIVGVAPPDFSFPDRDRRLYTPFVMPRTQTDAGEPQVRVFPAIARLSPGATPAQAAAEGTSVLRGLGPRPVAANLIFGQGGETTVHVRAFVEEVTARVRPQLLLLGIGVALVLVVSCANVASLFLFRAVARQRELAVRAAVGASRRRIVQQLMTESLLIAVAGGALGTLVAWQMIAVWPALAPRGFPRLDNVRFDWVVLVFAVAATLVAGVLAGIAPALQRGPSCLVTGLREGSGASAGRATTSMRRGLLIVETAFAVILLIGAALLLRSYGRLLATDPGYEAAHVLSARVSLQGGAVTPARWQGLTAGILDRVRALPGVESAGAASMAPLGDSTFMVGFRLPGNGGEPVIARAIGYIITPGYAEALRLRVRRGRLLTDADVSGSTQAMLVNERFATTYLNDGRPILGRQYAGLLAPNLTAEIVGVVGDVLKNGLLDAPQPEIYVALGNHGLLTIGRDINLVVRTAGDPVTVAGSVRDIVRDRDRTAPVHNVNPLATVLSATVGEARFATTMLAAFAALALGLAAVGLYGALSYWVSRRERELAVRAALGANRVGLLSLVLAEGLGVTAIGLVVGLAAAASLARLMRALVFGIDTLDPMSFALAAAILAVVALAACAVPAWRASGLDPAAALKSE